jgi:hypothetical protein
MSKRIWLERGPNLEVETPWRGKVAGQKQKGLRKILRPVEERDWN